MRSNIEAERARFQLTKEQLAKKLSITSKTYLSYVRGGPLPADKAVQMAILFNCSVDYLLGLTANRNRIS